MSDRAFRLFFGTAYYPEHWPEKRWNEDIRLMRQANMTVARMGEFAWSTLEPEAGNFNFDWLDRAIELLASNGILSILGTPTAAPPAWLVQQYPQILPIDQNNRSAHFGNRSHYCVNSPEFHKAVSQVVNAMAEHFGPNPHVIGWQIDNEYHRECYCDHCRASFHRYLADQYLNLEALNEHWSTRYWSQTYTAWEQIPLPIGKHNPGLMLAYKHFVTHSYQAFQKLQIGLLRQHIAPTVWITHNFMGWFDGNDPFLLSQDLDIASWDWYVGSGHNDALKSGAVHDMTRGLKQKNFILMETQPGSVNWSQVNNILNKGEARAMAWHAVAHGADGVLYWQWRSAYGGQEQYHGTLVDQSGQPRPLLQEVQQIGLEFTQVSDLIADSVPKARAALIYDPDSRWSIRWQPHHKDFDYLDHFNHYYRPLAARNLGIDILFARSVESIGQLSGYRILVVPALLIAQEHLLPPLRDFVHRGGHLILTMRTGMKDRHNALLPNRPPGALAELAGIEVEEYYALEEPVRVSGDWLDGQSHIWAERLKLIGNKTTRIIARYDKSNGWLDEHPAITVNAFGKGLVYYSGSYLDPESQQVFIEQVIENAGLKPASVPDGVELAIRVRPDGQEIIFAINHNRESKKFSCNGQVVNHLTKEMAGPVVDLPGYGVLLFTRIE